MNLLTNRKIQVLYFFVLTTAFFCTVDAQQKKSHFLIGKIVNSSNKAPVTYVMIINKTRVLSPSSDSLGNFSVIVTPGDTLILSRIGYYQKEIIITDALLTLENYHIIELIERTYELHAVNIEGLGSYESFKYKVINSELPKDENQINPQLKKAFEQKVIILEPQSRIPLGSPVTAIYMLLSKEGKSLRKLEKAEQKESEINLYIHKYSPEIVSKLTGLKELELEKFMKYCNLSNEFLKNALELDISEKVLDCFKNYKSESAKKEENTKP